ncbi:hypothetical protein CSV67_13665 [Sporosarcina sp. P2]|nr:hypothetical protein CSV67_13665 [Sporosarcina sp. P2]
MPIYNKLVRDLIPEIIEADGKTCVTRILNDSQYIAEINNKMHEELAEYEEASYIGIEAFKKKVSKIYERFYSSDQ